MKYSEWGDFINGIDFALLRKQKREIVQIAWRDNNELLEGLINLLDNLQDRAAETLGHEVVFGEDS